MAHSPGSLSLSSLYHLQSGTRALSPAILLMLFPLLYLHQRTLHMLQKFAPCDLSLSDKLTLISSHRALMQKTNIAVHDHFLTIEIICVCSCYTVNSFSLVFILVYVLFLSLLFLTFSLEQGRPLENYLGIVSEY